ncbi:hypothetical protein, partial [Bartonella sp. CL9QHWL]|uniref:hypothetical protein n=1 Tax=Bartonella sp. CL9QHWL TaxID=3243542 RepID=UPI0035CEF63D
LSETLAAAPSKLGTSLEKSPPNYLEFALKSALNRHKNGHPHGRVEFPHACVALQFEYIWKLEVYLMI